MPKKSKRDTSIAKASLAIYPVADAFETWLAKHIGSNPARHTRTFFAMDIHYGEHSMVREISVVTDNDTEAYPPIKFRSLLRSSSSKSSNEELAISLSLTGIASSLPDDLDLTSYFGITFIAQVCTLQLYHRTPQLQFQPLMGVLLRQTLHFILLSRSLY